MFAPWGSSTFRYKQDRGTRTGALPSIIGTRVGEASFYNTGKAFPSTPPFSFEFYLRDVTHQIRLKLFSLMELNVDLLVSNIRSSFHPSRHSGTFPNIIALHFLPYSLLVRFVSSCRRQTGRRKWLQRRMSVKVY